MKKSKSTKGNILKENVIRMTQLIDLQGAARSLISMALMIILISSCNKDEWSKAEGDGFDNSIASDIPKDQILTGEELEIQEFEEGMHDKIATEEADEKCKSINWNAELTIPENARSRYYYPLYCGYYNVGTTSGETNTANFYPGPDRIYFFRLTSEKQVHISLTDMTTDHDLFLTEVIITSSGHMIKGSTIATSLNSGSDDEQIDLVIPAGTYFMVVDAYRGSGSFKLELQCSNPAFTNQCENYDDLLPSYTSGIAAQSRYWRKWSSSANDANVLYENYERYPNKVVRFDQSRFGYQDVVRSLTNYHIIGGSYEAEIDMYIPHGKKAEFASEKLSRFGSSGEQGFQVRFDNGRIHVRHAGRYVTAVTRYPTDRWFKIKLIFNMNSDRIYLRYEDELMVEFTATSTISSATARLRSIWGLGFWAQNSTSQFSLDNICVKRYSSGTTSLIGAREMISLVPR